MDADPNHRQNWVYLKNSTTVVKRQEVGGGAFQEEPSSLSEAFAGVRKGALIRVHGGRDWDGSINVKRLEILSALDPSPPISASANPGVSFNLSYPASGWSGTVKDVTESHVILERENGANVVLPRGIGYSAEPILGAAVQAFVPAGSGELVSATADVMTVQTAQGLVQVPTMSVPKDVRERTQVPVLTKSGKAITLPLSTALDLKKAEGAAIISSRYQSPSSATSAVGAGVVLESGPDFTILATPDGGVLRVPRAAGSALPTPGLGVQVQSSGASFSLQPWKPGTSGGKAGGGNPGKASKGKGKKIKPS
jgi:hypothetical protein